MFYDLRAYGKKPRGKDAPEINLAPAFTAIRSLPAITPGPTTPSRYLQIERGQLLMEIFEDGSEQIRGGFAIKTNQDLPRLEKSGAWSDLTLEAEQGLAFIRHFIYWKSRALLGIEVKAGGPGLGALETYLVAQAGKALGFTKCEATVYLATDRFDVLLASDRITSASIGIMRDDIEALNEWNTDVASGLRQAARASNAHELRIEFLLGDRRPDASLTLPRLRELQRIIGDPQKRKKLTELKARARDMDLEAMEVLDLLEDKFVAREQVVVSNNGVVDRDSMLHAIHTAASDLTTTN
jgi:hypothetical protein